MRHVERQRDPGHAVGRVPIVGEPEVGLEAEPARLELVAELAEVRLEWTARDPDAEVAQAEPEQIPVVPVRPDGLSPPQSRRRRLPHRNALGSSGSSDAMSGGV
jgi:hypothetical protein